MAKNTENKSKSLVIVESPAKAKTIEKYLGSEYIVASSIGHIRDLAKNNLSIDKDNNFKPIYEISNDKKKIVSELQKLSKSSKDIYLATDEDREGEAIAWHLCEILNLDIKTTKRIVFHEITKKAITDAIQKPRVLNVDLVNAQQARRVLDRLVGYELSPVLWKKVQRGLSAGRVQSVAVRLIVEREKEIENFVQDSSYKITAEFKTENDKLLTAELKTRFDNLKSTEEFLKSIIDSTFTVTDISTKETKRTPSAPFTTSTLQQEAARKLGFSVKQTMVIAQKLYESGKITYMRTDSVNLSELALQNAQEVIESEFGAKYYEKRYFKNKNESAQEAHEAIRPTDLNSKTTTGDRNSQKLYELIWKRTVASQMSVAILEKTTVNIAISNSNEIFQANGEVVKFDGFFKLYFESSDDESNESETENLLPRININEILNYNFINAKELFKNSPPRYNEASLVKKLEEMGIGRPSTYAPTISTIIDRGYVIKQDREGKSRNYMFLKLENKELVIEKKSENYGSEKQKLFPTTMGAVVNDFLTKHFDEIVNYNFTAKIEEQFDEIASGNKSWNKMIENFYSPFKDSLDKSNEISKAETVNLRVLGIEPKSGKKITARLGRFGPMLQLGDLENENEKPKYVAIPKNLIFDQITLEDALKLFELPRTIGEAPNGQIVTASKGRFGPFVKMGDTFVSITDDELFSITLEEAIEKIENKIHQKSMSLIKEFEEDKSIRILNGRFGPYITNGKSNVRVPKSFTPELLSFTEASKLIEEASKKKNKQSTGTKTTSKATKKTKTIKKK